ncbi:hypothetical protein U9M48_031492 [Paspalum notatum var. saurae]|uniref:Reverse transcriptase Ty1/copia-type domain-containing protein n=1 Tax=Paspalum notatum var. saurae TaxID=547442 RepID=A0AAQ3X3T1_PASNO
MVLWNARTAHLLRWHGRCSMSIGLQGAFGPRREYGCYIANRIFLRAFLGKTSYELRFGKQPASSICERLAAGALCLRRRGIWTSLSLVVWMGFFSGYASNSRAFRVWILEAKQVVETCEVSFDETMPRTTPPLSFRVMMKKALPFLRMRKVWLMMVMREPPHRRRSSYPLATSSMMKEDPRPTLPPHSPDKQAQAQAGPAEDVGEIVPSRQVRRDHPPHGMIGDIHRRVTRSSPRDVSHALSDPNRVNAMHEELENFERNHVRDLVEPPPNRRPIGTKWVFKNKRGEDGMVVRNKARLVARGFVEGGDRL